MEEQKVRVGAMIDSKDNVIRFLGYGTLLGFEIPPKEFNDDVVFADIPNPKILLDNGDIVWGFECWWMDEFDMRDLLDNALEIRIVSIADYRKGLLNV